MIELSQDQWAEQLSQDTNAVVLDVRTQGEVNEGKIPKSIHLDIYKGEGFIEEVKKLDKNKHYYIYCRSGNRSGQACALMQQLGFENTYNLLGGITDWEGAIE